MKRALLIAGVLGLTATATGKEMIDPFINPILTKEQILIENKDKETLKEIPKEINLFKPKIDVPFSKLSIQGVIKKDGKRYLVLLDPETGETFILTEGDPISPNEKIAKITNGSITVFKYRKFKGKLIKEEIKLNVDTEGLNND